MTAIEALADVLDTIETHESGADVTASMACCGRNGGQHRAYVEGYRCACEEIYLAVEALKETLEKELEQ